MVEEARLEETDGGLAPATEGWFVVNVRDGRWVTNDVLGAAFILEGDDVGFPQVGYTIGILEPGQAGGITGSRRRKTSSSCPASACS